MKKTLIIAEPGGTHEGKLYVMLELVRVAAQCGVGCFKSQWVSNAQTMCDRRRAPDYLSDYLKLQYPLEWHVELRELAKSLGMQYACTCYIPGDFKRMAPFVDYLKIASFEAADEALFKEARRAAGPGCLIVSYGMGARVTARRLSCLNLACVSAYPTPLAELNLGVLRKPCGESYGEGFTFDGFSDHSHDVRVGAWAVATGASILETHFRLDDCNPDNKDYEVAFTPYEFYAYVKNVRDCELALGDGVKKIQPCEADMAKYRVKP